MYEYKVIEAPTPAARGWFGLKKSSYADTLCDAINELAVESWEFQRAEQGPKRASPDLLVFRRRVAKADEKMAAPKSFADRMIEAEHRGDDREAHDGQSYEGPVRPRRARIIGDAGPMTERPKALTAKTLDADVIDGTARRVTPMKPMSAAG